MDGSDDCSFCFREGRQLRIRPASFLMTDILFATLLQNAKKLLEPKITRSATQ